MTDNPQTHEKTDFQQFINQSLNLNDSNFNQQNSNLPPVQPHFSTHSQLYRVEEVDKKLVNYNHLTYALMLASYFTGGITAIVAVILSYAKRDESRHTWLYSHFDWQIKSFWYGIFFSVVATGLMIFGFGSWLISLILDTEHTAVFTSSSLVGVVGLLMMLVVSVWHFYRLVRGWVALGNKKAVP